MALITPPEGKKTTWKIEGQSFDVNSKSIDLILTDMFETNLDKKEHGFLMCDTPDEGVIPGEHCHGNECSIQLTDCKAKGGVTVGSFHSHPEVISFSLTDYIMAAARAQDHPEKKGLLCVSLKDAGVRCKAVKKMPPEELINQLFIMPDNDTTREMIKPFFTKKVNISVQQLKELQSGVAWDKLTPSEEVIAIDEGDDVCAPSGKGCLGKEGYPAPGKGGQPMAKTLIQVAQEYIKEPTGKYPWETKEVSASVASPFGVAKSAKKMPELVSRETQFIKAEDIELPDPKMLAYGEVAEYIKAFSPIILKQEKNEKGQWKILDGRHRLAGLRASGYTQIPVVFALKAKDYEEI